MTLKDVRLTGPAYISRLNRCYDFQFSGRGFNPSDVTLKFTMTKPVNATYGDSPCYQSSPTCYKPVSDTDFFRVVGQTGEDDIQLIVKVKVPASACNSTWQVTVVNDSCGDEAVAGEVIIENHPCANRIVDCPSDRGEKDDDAYPDKAQMASQQS